MKKAFAVLVVLAMFPAGGCASSSPAPHPSPRAFDNVRRLAIVASGETRFAVLEHSSEPGRTFDEVLKWNPYRAVLAPLMRLVHQGINTIRFVRSSASRLERIGGARTPSCG